MCDCCSGKEIKIENSISHTMQIENGIMTISGETPVGEYNTGFEVDIKINICPFCGRELNIEYGFITDEELDAYANFTEHEKKIIKEMYSTHKKGTFPNPRCALY